MRPERLNCAESVDNHVYNTSAITERLQAYNELNKKKDVCQFEGLCSSTDTPRKVGRGINRELVSYLAPVLTGLYARGSWRTYLNCTRSPLVEPRFTSISHLLKSETARKTEYPTCPEEPLNGKEIGRQRSGVCGEQPWPSPFGGDYHPGSGGRINIASGRRE